LHGRKINLSYRRRGTDEQRQYQVNPLGIVFVDQVVYLVCTFYGYSDLRHLALHRMSDAELCEEAAEIVKGFNLQTYVQSDVFGLPRSDQQIAVQVLFEAASATHLMECPLS
jgi:predicted DNA-binding transcriptional regulator YafY